jgi:hypothetical protein
MPVRVSSVDCRAVEREEPQMSIENCSELLLERSFAKPRWQASHRILSKRFRGTGWHQCMWVTLLALMAILLFPINEARAVSVFVEAANFNNFLAPISTDSQTEAFNVIPQPPIVGLFPECNEVDHTGSGIYTCVNSFYFKILAKDTYSSTTSGNAMTLLFEQLSVNVGQQKSSDSYFCGGVWPLLGNGASPCANTGNIDLTAFSGTLAAGNDFGTFMATLNVLATASVDPAPPGGNLAEIFDPLEISSVEAIDASTGNVLPGWSFNIVEQTPGGPGPQDVPEPPSWAILAVGLVLLCRYRIISRRADAE